MTLYAKKTGFRSGRKPKQNYETRICVYNGCNTPLSIYNKKTYCFQHTPVSYPRVRGHVIKGDW